MDPDELPSLDDIDALLVVEDGVVDGTPDLDFDALMAEMAEEQALRDTRQAELDAPGGKFLDPGTIRGDIRDTAQGMIPGTDEFEATIASMLSDKTYEQYHGELMDEQRQRFEENPGRQITNNLLGTTLSTIATGGATAGAATGNLLANSQKAAKLGEFARKNPKTAKILYGLGINLPANAAWGAAAGEEGTRAESTGVGVGIGAALDAVFMGIPAGFRKIAKTELYNTYKNKLTNEFGERVPVHMIGEMRRDIVEKMRGRVGRSTFGRGPLKDKEGVILARTRRQIAKAQEAKDKLQERYDVGKKNVKAEAEVETFGENLEEILTQDQQQGQVDLQQGASAKLSDTIERQGAGDVQREFFGLAQVAELGEEQAEKLNAALNADDFMTALEIMDGAWSSNGFRSVKRTQFPMGDQDIQTFAEEAAAPLGDSAEAMQARIAERLRQARNEAGEISGEVFTDLRTEFNDMIDATYDANATTARQSMQAIKAKNQFDTGLEGMLEQLSGEEAVALFRADKEAWMPLKALRKAVKKGGTANSGRFTEEELDTSLRQVFPHEYSHGKAPLQRKAEASRALREEMLSEQQLLAKTAKAQASAGKQRRSQRRKLERSATQRAATKREDLLDQFETDVDATNLSKLEDEMKRLEGVATSNEPPGMLSQLGTDAMTGKLALGPAAVAEAATGFPSFGASTALALPYGMAKNRRAASQGGMDYMVGARPFQRRISEALREKPVGDTEDTLYRLIMAMTKRQGITSAAD